MAASLPRVKFEIDPNDSLTGVKVMSIVGEPAIESDFVFFNKQKGNYIELKGEKYKQVVAGLALIPDKDILRLDKEGNPYVGYFTKESIEVIQNKFHKEQMSNRVNTDHDSNNYVDAYLIESFIVDSEERLNDVKAKGIEEVVIGSWFVAYKIEDAEVFKKVLNKEFRGFSVEIFLSQLYKKENNNLNQFEKVMSTILSRFKQLLAEVEGKETPAIKFEDSKDANGQLIRYTSTGNTVSIVAVNEDGTEKVDTAPDGEYVLENGKTVTVASGVATAIKDTEAAPEEQKKEEKLGRSLFADYELAEGGTINVCIQEVNSVELRTADGDYQPATDGEYPLKDGGTLVVEGGKFKEVKGIADAKTLEEKENQEQMNKEMEALKAEVAKHKAELLKATEEITKLKKEPLTDPVLKTDLKKSKKLTDEEVNKLDNAERILYKKGLL